MVSGSGGVDRLGFDADDAAPAPATDEGPASSLFATMTMRLPPRPSRLLVFYVLLPSLACPEASRTAVKVPIQTPSGESDGRRQSDGSKVAYGRARAAAALADGKWEARTPTRDAPTLDAANHARHLVRLFGLCCLSTVLLDAGMSDPDDVSHALLLRLFQSEFFSPHLALS